MSTVSTVNPISATPPAASPPPVMPSGPPSPLETEIIAYGSATGVSLRLLASLPANLGQHIDGAA